MTDIIDNVYVRNVITGIDGQDGRILSAILEDMGEEVFGISRTRTTATGNYHTVPAQVDISKKEEFDYFLNLIKPTRIFHLAASHANSSEMFSHGQMKYQEMLQIHSDATRSILEWQSRNLVLQSNSVIALSSQLYTAKSPLTIVNEDEPINPSTKYGESKKFALDFIRRYREDFGVNSSGAILFNHSSIHSKPNFVLQILAKQIAKAIEGKVNVLKLKNFNAILDISDANEICHGLNKMARMSEGSEYILSSGIATNLRDLATQCLTHYKMEKNVTLMSTHDEDSPHNALIGNPGKAKNLLNWRPTTNQLSLLISLVEYHLARKD